MSTPSPYLRDRLLQAVAGLRKDAETARLNLAAADQDVAAARALLQEAEAQRDRARAEVGDIEAGIAWAQAQAHAITREIDADPAAKLRATGLMRHEPKEVPYAEHIGHRVDVLTTDLERTRGHLVRAAGGWLTLRTPDGEQSIPDEQVRHVARAEGSLALEAAKDSGPVSAALYQDNGLPMVWSDLDPPGGYVCAVYETAGGPGIDMPNGTRICGTPVESEPCDRHGPPHDDLTAPGVADTRAQIAPHLPPPVPHDPAGVPVATHGPTVTMPDTGLNPDPLPPAPPTAEPRHAKPADRPGLLARLTGGHRTIRDEQDGDQTDG